MEEDKTIEFLELCLPNYSSRDDVALLLDLELWVNSKLTREELNKKYPRITVYRIDDIFDVIRNLHRRLLKEAVNNLDFKSIKTLA